MSLPQSNYYDELHRKLELIQAVLNGRVIEFCEQFETVWSVVDEPDFTCSLRRYRIKPLPLVRWLVLCEDGSEFGMYSQNDWFTADMYSKQVKGRTLVKLMEVT